MMEKQYIIKTVIVKTIKEVIYKFIRTKDLKEPHMRRNTKDRRTLKSLVEERLQKEDM